MNRLVIIGNGFDLAHGLKTSYKDFIDWYWDQRVDTFSSNCTPVSEDCLCKITIRDKGEQETWGIISYHNSYFKDIDGNRKVSGTDVIREIREDKDNFSFEATPFFLSILESVETKGWVDIENDYYRLLKKQLDNPRCGYTIPQLNDQLNYIKEKLVEYLSTISTPSPIKIYHDAIVDFFKPEDFAPSEKNKALESIGSKNTTNPKIKISFEEIKKLIPQQIMLLSFNYTSTAQTYGNFNLTLNYIHGELTDPKNIIFGYGDELDKDYRDMLEMNDNDIIKYAKSVRYLETGHYRKLLEFIHKAPFQVFIMGHSCGNSDRTLLNTVFEHDNCVSIKPFYHKWDDGTDNYLELVQNIYRNFTDMKKFRDRVVNKTRCSTLG